MEQPVEILSSPSQIPPVPTTTPVEFIEELRSLFLDHDINAFRGVLEAHEDRFDIRDLDPLMIDAIRRDDTQFTTELLRRGLSLVPDYAVKATEARAKNVLEVFFANGWVINRAVSGGKPPILG